MTNHFEINVSLNGKHFFATNQRSLTYRIEYEKVLATLKEKFPQSEGYEITSQFIIVSGMRLDINEPLPEHLFKSF